MNNKLLVTVLALSCVFIGILISQLFSVSAKADTSNSENQSVAVSAFISPNLGGGTTPVAYIVKGNKVYYFEGYKVVKEIELR